MPLGAIFAEKARGKEVITIRVPIDTLKTIDQKAGEVDISRNELINQMILFALENMSEEEPD